MITIAMSAQGWSEFPDAVPSLLKKLIEYRSDYSIIIDANSMAREVDITGGTLDVSSVHLIKFEEWIKDGLIENGVLDVFAIRNSGGKLSADRPVILDARGRRLELILEALPHVRYAWFPLEQWHPAFVLLCDDVFLLPLGKALADTFYCQPNIATEKEVAQIVKNIWRSARVNRWLGTGIGRWQRSLFQRFNNILSKVSEISDR